MKPGFESRASDFRGYMLNQITLKFQVNKEIKVEMYNLQYWFPRFSTI